MLHIHVQLQGSEALLCPASVAFITNFLAHASKEAAHGPHNQMTTTPHSTYQAGRRSMHRGAWKPQQLRAGSYRVLLEQEYVTDGKNDAYKVLS